MKYIKSLSFLRSISFFCLFIILFSCNKDKEPEPASFNVNGTWVVSEEISGNCQGATYPDYVTDVFELLQDGNSIIMTQMLSGQKLTGTIEGSKISWSGVLRENRGSNNINFSGNVLNKGDSLAGNATWVYTKGTYNCSGTAKVTAYKIGNISINTTGIWKGTWTSEKNEATDEFTADITQNNGVLTGTIDVPYIGLEGAELTGSVSGSSFTFGDIDKSIMFTGIIGTDTMHATGNYKYDRIDDKGTWQATKTVKLKPVEWIVNELAVNSVTQQNLTICNAQNDGVNRIYTCDGNQGNGVYYELTYNSGVWENRSYEYSGEESFMVNAIACGNIQNNGQNRLYACGNGLFEHNISNTGWDMEVLDTEYGWLDDIAIGTARNDDIVRLYAGSWEEMFEFTYAGGSWSHSTINTNNRKIDQLLITDGRNDGVLRLYAATDNKLLEYTFADGEWGLTNTINADVVGVEEIVAGDGRNDGKNRIYVAANGGVGELDYSEGTWNITQIGEISYSSYIAVGSGRDDGINRVYVVVDQELLIEFTFVGSWVKSSELHSGIMIQSIAVGAAQSDDKNRVYSTANSRIYEYELD